MELRVECEYCERTRTLIKLDHSNMFECKTCGTIQEIDTYQEEIT